MNRGPRSTPGKVPSKARGPQATGHGSRIDPEKELRKLLNSKNEKIRLEALKVWLPYHYGRPTSSSNVNAEVRLRLDALPIPSEFRKHVQAPGAGKCSAAR